MKALGRHILLELYDCDNQILNDHARVEQIMKDAALYAKATIVESVFHKFNPHGVSGVVVIAESHLAVHTWPEYGYAAVDLFTCGEEIDPWRAQQFVVKKLQAKRNTALEIKRGVLKVPALRHKP